MSNTRRLWITGLLAIGGALLLYGLLFGKSDKNAPSWEPVNVPLISALEKMAVTAEPENTGVQRDMQETSAGQLFDGQVPQVEETSHLEQTPQAGESSQVTPPQSDSSPQSVQSQSASVPPPQYAQSQPTSQADPSQADPSQSAPAAPDAGASAPSGIAARGAPLLDLNTATQSQLEDLPGIGPSKAQAIIAYREREGGFRTVEQLMEVKGIGAKIFEKLSAYVNVASPR